MIEHSSLLILRNTLLLYGRMLITMWLNLYATRLVLQNLGVEDMGTYGVVGSIINMLAVFTNGITTAIQRFITYELGLKDKGDVNKVFCSSFNLLLLLAAGMVLILETVGLLVLYHCTNIPSGSMDNAFWVFQCSIVTCVFFLLVIPYQALIIAYEKMGAFALFSIINVVLTCLACYSLSWLDPDKRLIWYSVFMSAIAITTPIIYKAYCDRKFLESRYHFLIDRMTIREMGRFTGISSTSGILQLISSEGITLVINWTFGVALNAVYVIALQLKNMVLSFALNLFKAIQPQITKTYAEGDMKRHKALVYSGSKLEIFLIYFILIPFIFRTRYVLSLWLGNDIPEYTIAFCQCTIFLSLTYAAFEPIRTAVLTTTKITHFLLIPDSIAVLSLPLIYLAAKITNTPEIMIACIVAVDIFCCIVRVYLGTRVSVISMSEVATSIIIRCIAVAACSLSVCYGLSLVIPDNLLGLISLIIINSLALAIIIISIGLNKEEKQIVYNIKSGILH